MIFVFSGVQTLLTEVFMLFTRIVFLTKISIILFSLSVFAFAQSGKILPRPTPPKIEEDTEEENPKEPKDKK